MPIELYMPCHGRLRSLVCGIIRYGGQGTELWHSGVVVYSTCVDTGPATASLELPSPDVVCINEYNKSKYVGHHGNS